MDPFSGEGELFNIQTAFHQSQYAEVVSFDTSAFSSANKTAASILKYRAQIALGEDTSSPAPSSTEIPEPDLSALKALAQSSKDSSSSSALSSATSLASAHPDNATVQICCGTILAAHEQYDEALSLLSKHQGNLEAVALITQIHLMQNRTDLALKEVNKAKAWAQDNIVVNMAEAWVGLRVGGESYQSTFYVYEELASAPSSTTTTSLIGQAVSEIHLGRLPEAEAALQQALSSSSSSEKPDPVLAQALANSIVLSSLQGKAHTEQTQTWLQQLKALGQPHALLQDLEDKDRVFEEARAKYAAKVAS